LKAMQLLAEAGRQAARALTASANEAERRKAQG
jgi:hypothetical protein